MPLILGLVALIALVFGMVMLPRWRKPGAVVLGVVGVAVVWQIGFNAPKAPSAPLVSEVSLSAISVEVGPRLTTVTGRVSNTSETGEVNRINLFARLLECPMPADADAACAVLGEDEISVAVTVPPGQTRAFTAPLRFANAPAARQNERVRVQLSSVDGS
ncbi:MAG: hypothetical protein AAGJ96_08830 [Pseudomonadota bacterium]